LGQSINSIVALTGLELESPALQETITYYVDHFGLELEQHASSWAALKGTGPRGRQVMFVAGEQRRLRGLNFELDQGANLDELAKVLGNRGIRAESQSPGTLCIKDPDGTNISLSRGTSAKNHQSTPAKDRPIFLSHVVINSPDAAQLVAFYVEILGLRVSDKYEKGLLTFLRADQPQHHCIGISPASYSSLNHFAMDCGTIDGVMMGVGRMKRAGFEPVWGPGRHRPGGNIFCYFEDPNGFVAEFTCDVLSISDDEQWVAKEWQRTPENGNVWGTGGPTPRAIKLMNGNPTGN
jgi:catechol 2,3-dioxygenase-like lactoylglutathione lyase family enzyme